MLFLVRCRYALDEQLRGVSIVTALSHGGDGVHAQAALLLQRSVAGVAARLQHGLDLRQVEAPLEPQAVAAERYVAGVRRLAEQPVILVVGDTVFTHGGLSPEHVARGIDAINDEVRRWYLGQGEISPELLQDDGSPVWTRRYCQNPRPSDCAALREALAAVPAKRLVVGHTVHTEGIQSACDETVWCIDVGMAAYYGGPVQALEIRGDSVAILRAGATSPAP